VSPETNTEFRNTLNNFINELSKDVNFTAKIAQMKKAMHKWKPTAKPAAKGELTPSAPKGPKPDKPKTGWDKLRFGADANKGQATETKPKASGWKRFFGKGGKKDSHEESKAE
jgi:hypothetical protein